MNNNIFLSTIGACFILGAQGAMAITCTGTISNRTVDEVIVPKGKSCTLNYITVESGNVQANDASTLYINNSTIEIGDIQADKAYYLSIYNTNILNGNVQAVETKIVSLFRLGVDKGSIQVSKGYYAFVGYHYDFGNQARNGDTKVSEFNYVLVTNNNAPNGNIQVEKNGHAKVINNSAGGNIQCSDNGVLSHSDNVADGNLECIN